MPAIIDKSAGALHLHNGTITQDIHGDKIPVFDGSKVTVIFVLGGPGAGTIPFCKFLHLLDP
jgi:hypothetical protein